MTRAVTLGVVVLFAMIAGSIMVAGGTLAPDFGPNDTTVLFPPADMTGLHDAERLMDYIVERLNLSSVNRSQTYYNPITVGPGCCLVSWTGATVAVVHTSVISRTFDSQDLMFEYTGNRTFASLQVLGHVGNPLETGDLEEMSVRVDLVLEALGLSVDGIQKVAFDDHAYVTVNGTSIRVPTKTVVVYANRSGLPVAFGNEIRMTFDLDHRSAIRLVVFPWFDATDPTVVPAAALAQALSFLNETARETLGMTLSRASVSLAFDSIHYAMVYHVEALYVENPFGYRVWVDCQSGAVLFWQTMGPPPGGPSVSASGSNVVFFFIGGVLVATTLAAFYSEPVTMALSLIAAVLYARLSRASALEHFVRGQVYAFVATHPGASYSEIRDAFSLHNGAATHHLRVLTRLGFLKAVSEGRRKLFFLSEAKGKPLGRKLTGLQYTILEAIEHEGSMTPREVATTVGMSRQRAHYNLRRMTEMGLLSLDGASYRLRENTDFSRGAS